MAILLKYREVVAAGPLAVMLVQLSKRLRRLETLLRDPAETQFVIVTRAAALPRQESARLQQHLADLQVASATTIVNAVGSGSCARCRAIARAQRDELVRLRRALRSSTPYAIIGTPAMIPPPHGASALAAWGCTWRRLH
jgi:anion-transporting  ArsA/GET3 family ATPase